MKKILLMMALIVGIFSSSARDNYSHDVNSLPVAARTMLKNNFKAAVNHIKIEKELGRIHEYEVVLNDGSEITFDHSGNWKDVEMGKNKAVPTALVPVGIATYVNQHQNKSKVIGIEKKKSGYEVELANGVEIKFDSNGKFISYEYSVKIGRIPAGANGLTRPSAPASFVGRDVTYVNKCDKDIEKRNYICIFTMR